AIALKQSGLMTRRRLGPSVVGLGSLILIDLSPGLPLPGLFLEDHDQNRRYSDFLLPQWILCRCRSRGRNSAWLTTGVAYTGQVRCSRMLPHCLLGSADHYDCAIFERNLHASASCARVRLTCVGCGAVTAPRGAP